MTSLETMTLNMKAIVACDSNYGIGMYNNLPNWKLKDDLKKFKQLTIGNGNNAIIMGKNTWLSIDKKPLLNRMNYVLTTCDIVSDANNVYFYSNYNVMITDICEKGYDTVWVIGGSQIYDLFIDYCNELYISKTYEAFKCSTFLSQKVISYINANFMTLLESYETNKKNDGYARYICKIE